ncbi:ArsR family transcriptional regulator [Candidatus Bathyarchaeota archaeon]|nr:ArsR family transcriptional regulator [Candidatus Bathyarchaeota archaeon]
MTEEHGMSMKKVGDELEKAIFQALGADERREMLRVASRGEGASYTEILGELNMTTGNLNYHLRQLEGFLEKDDERRYRLTPLGELALKVLGATGSSPDEIDGYISTARESQSGATHPTVTNLLRLALFFNVLFLAIWGYLAYVFLVEGGPTFVFGVLFILICVGFVTLTWLIRGLRTAPTYVRRLERGLGLNPK